jgi:hypothetical protein
MQVTLLVVRECKLRQGWALASSTALLQIVEFPETNEHLDEDELGALLGLGSCALLPAARHGGSHVRQCASSLRIGGPASEDHRSTHIVSCFRSNRLRLALHCEALGICAAYLDDANGWVGGSRHALTVAFIAAMVFAVGHRVLPAFAGMKVLYSPRLMLAGLLLLNVGAHCE